MGELTSGQKTTSPAASAGTAADSGMPSAAAACHKRPPRPGWSAAASNNRVCVSAGSLDTPYERTSSW